MISRPRRIRANALLRGRCCSVSCSRKQRKTCMPSGRQAWLHTSSTNGTTVAMTVISMTTMATAAPRVALLESRMSRELARLVEKHGGDPVCVPAVRESYELDAATAGDLVSGILTGSYDVVVFMTGVAVS